MTLVEVLQNHLEVCDSIYTLMIDLNQELKSTKNLPGEDLLDRKRAALIALDISLHHIRGIATGAELQSPEVRSVIEKGQRTILKALLLDRENEQLLLKNAVPAVRTQVKPKPTPHHLANIYRKHS